MRKVVPPRAEIEADTPLRLSVAAVIAFPDGSMSASGLRRESARGRLQIERIAGKDYTTLASIERMRELCRVEAKVHHRQSDCDEENTRLSTDITVRLAELSPEFWLIAMPWHQ